MAKEILNILSKTLNTPAVVYELQARSDGNYNVYVQGSPLPTGTPVFLKKGEVWKFGEMTSPKNRYDNAYLNSENVNFVPISSGTQLQMKVMEKLLIYGYYFQNGKLPPGNKIFR